MWARHTGIRVSDDDVDDNDDDDDDDDDGDDDDDEDDDGDDDDDVDTDDVGDGDDDGGDDAADDFASPGKEAPEKWRGDLNITYRLGPDFSEASMEIELVVNNKREIKSIYNVIGTIYGKEEPNRYVLMGNHRDAWVFGAVDASSGTSTTTEVARGLGRLRKEGWIPRRTIKVSAAGRGGQRWWCRCLCWLWWW